MSDDKLKHIGVKRKSGRYPWGSGEDPYQGLSFNLKEYKELRKKHSETEVAEKLGLTTTQLRDRVRYANKEIKEHLQNQITTAKQEGYSNTAIAKELGISEGSVRNYLAKTGEDHKVTQLDNIEKAIKKGVEQTGYLDVGVGVELQLGVPRTRFNAVVNKLVEEEGYTIHEVYESRLYDPSKKTIIKTLTKDPDIKSVVQNKDKIRPLDSWSDDRGETIANINDPKPIDPKRVKIRYNEEGGVLKDGVIELRPGVDELDMGSSHYAQVRIKVGEDRFLKGMAVYGDQKDFPEGVDIIFNTNKHVGTDKRDVLKKIKSSDESDNEFGSTIIRQNKSNVLNIVNEEGEWDTWSTGLASQFLGKQPASLIKDRLDATYDDLKKEYDEINAIEHPVVKQHLLEGYSAGLDAKAKKLSAKGLDRTKSHVILPFPDMKPDEIYAPYYEDGEKVVLLRYPHGGVFELPEVRVNNKNPQAKKVLGRAPDAIGIHPSVAEKLSGADFDGDTVYVIPNNKKGPLEIKTSRSLKELKNFDPMDYKVPRKTIDSDTKEMQMGIVSNLITDMTIKGAEQGEIARAVKHSMVVIDSEKHNLDWKQSARDNGISALKRQYQRHYNPDKEKITTGGSTLLSLSKRKIDISQGKTARDLAADKVDKKGKVLKKGLTTDEIATRLKISKKTVEGYLKGEEFDPSKYSSGTKQETLYVQYVKRLQGLKNSSEKSLAAIKMPSYNKDAAVAYKEELKELNAKIDNAKLNAPRERQAQILSNKIFYSNVRPEMSKDQVKKLKSRSLARARETTGAKGKKATITLTDREWDAIEARAVSATKVKEILRYADMDQIRKYATPRPSEMTPTKERKVRELLDRGYTYDQVAKSIGVKPSSLKRAKATSAKAQRAKALVSSGKSIKEVARQLGISESAVQAALD